MERTMPEKTDTHDARRYALIALAVLLAERIAVSGVFVLKPGAMLFKGIPAVAIVGFVFSWILPPLIVYRIEKRDLGSLGLSVEPERWLRYGAYALVGLVLPAVFVGVDRALLVDFVEQVIYIGVAEELFSRGYLLTRLCEWLGKWRGLVLSALIFGLSHVASLVSQHGFAYPTSDLMMFGQTFVGGLLLGYIYLKAKNIVPGSILHVAGNLYISRIATLLSR
jgi:membrane protease YdiL (CAAX protease family)